jgi:SAM-dependent methyltransferase
MTILGAAKKLARTVQDKGILGLVRVALNRVRIELVKQTPARRRARKEARDFDRRHGTDTATHATVDPSLPNAAHAVRYQPSGRDMFDAILATLAVDTARFTFVDIGSGKGRALLFASDHPWRRIIGIEFGPELHAIAVANVRVYSAPTQKCRDIEPILGDATTVTFPDGPLFIYMYNPFSQPIMGRFADHLRRALEASPREAWVVYLNPVERDCFDGAPWLERVHDAGEWAAWRAR